MPIERDFQELKKNETFLNTKKQTFINTNTQPPPMLRRKRTVSICSYIFIFIYLSIYLSVYLYLSIYRSICLSMHREAAKEKNRL